MKHSIEEFLPKKPKKKAILLKIDQELYQKLETKKKKFNTSMTKLLVAILKEYLG